MNLRNYILENDFKIIYLTNKLNIVNYSDISHFDNNKIIINYKGGKNLVVSKLVSDELLIEGSINNIEFR